MSGCGDPVWWLIWSAVNRYTTTLPMSYTLVEESLEGVASAWRERRHCSRWSPIFVLPAWLKVWWDVFGADAQLYLRSLRQEDDLVGLAPLLVKGETASFIGSPDVCDYLDFVVVPGREDDLFSLLLDDLKERGVRRLDLGPLRGDSTVSRHLVGIARGRGHEVLCERDDVSLELDLPATWGEYLAMLSSKQRHEVRRKLRRLHEAGNTEHDCVLGVGEADEYLDLFLRLFSVSGEEKAGFMTPKMELFFRSLGRAMADMGSLRLGVLRLDGVPVSMTMGFDHNGSHYLYNSAYDPRFSHLSVGLLCKALCLRKTIESGMQRWNFLKGAEPYKYQLGGREVELFRCQITMA